MITPMFKAIRTGCTPTETFTKNLYETIKADKASIIGKAELMYVREYLKNHP